MKKLAIVEEREDDKYEHSTVIKCWTCDSLKGREIPDATNDAKVRASLVFISPVRPTKDEPFQDQISVRWSNAVHVICAPIRGQSLGRRNQSL